jgi:hypothetical protein
MKAFLLLCLYTLAVSTAAQSFAQANNSEITPKPFARKIWQLGIQGGYSKAQFLANNLTTQFYGGYYVANKLMLGASASWSGEWTKRVIETNLLSVGPAIRYQFTQTRLSPFVAAAYRFGTYTFTSQDYSSTSGNSGFRTYQNNTISGIHSRSVSVGLTIGITSALRGEVVANWQDAARPSDAVKIGSSNLWQAQVGLSYLLLPPQ